MLDHYIQCRAPTKPNSATGMGRIAARERRPVRLTAGVEDWHQISPAVVLHRAAAGVGYDIGMQRL